MADSSTKRRFQNSIMKVSWNLLVKICTDPNQDFIVIPKAKDYCDSLCNRISLSILLAASRLLGTSVLPCDLSR